MLEIYMEEKKTWCAFYPIKIPIVLFEEIDKRKLEELPEKIYGKICIGACGYNSVWSYQTVDKKNIRVRKEK